MHELVPDLGLRARGAKLRDWVLDARDVRVAVARFQSPSLGRSLTQSAVSLGCFLGVCGAMYWALGVSGWITAGLAPLAAFMLVRIFIIQHDCGHGSYFRSRHANLALGVVCGILTLTPYATWRRQHAGHHGVWNDLDRRQSGADIYSTCLTIAEYAALSPWRRRWYRLTRHPLVANILLPPLVFIVLYRLPFDAPASWRRERWGVHLTNLALGVLIVGLGLTIGFGKVVAVQLPVMVLASIIGVWLFSVQHRFAETTWARRERWDPTTAALRGASHLRLPPLLRWLTGSIGLHHIHHLNPRIPNYRLQDCPESNPFLDDAPKLTLWSGLMAVRFTLWDEGRGRMVTFRDAEG
ncbi:MAG: fatty acid desaturase [Alphaproteobacteria bacterium]|nr:fatty acid desaturase [Alphaproteobacteria bacterium]